MPGPQFGGQAALGNLAAQNELQQMVAERHAAATALRDYVDKRNDLAFDQKYKILEHIQRGDIAAATNEVAKANAQANLLRAQAPKAPEIRQVEVNVPGTPAVPANKGWWDGLGATPGKPATPDQTELRFVNPITSEVYSRIPQGPKPAPKPENPDRVEALVNGLEKDQIAAGGQPFTAQERIAKTHEVAQKITAFPPQAPDPNIALARSLEILAKQRELAQDLPPTLQRAVNQKSQQYESDATVKNFASIAEARTFVESLGSRNNPQDDQGLIYAFAKAMDPSSAVREGEYATVQKYAQSWLESFKFNAQRVLQNTEFLSPEAKANIKATIRSKFDAEQQRYNAIRGEYAKQVEKMTGRPGGADYLVDYASGFGGTAGGADVKTTAQSGQPYVSQNPPVRSKDGTKILGKIGTTAVELVPDGKGGYLIK